MIWHALAALVAGVLLAWVALVVSLCIVGRRTDETSRWADTLRLIPDVLRLMHRLTTDRSLPRIVRIELGLLLMYLASPIDLIPDVIPIVGYADDAIIVMIALRAATRSAGAEAIDRHWPGTPDGLAAIKRLSRIHD